MFTPAILPGVAGSYDHFAFVERTDRRNLRTQLKNLVSLAKDIAARDLNVRRNKLRDIIEQEDKMFEEEFARSAKARLQSEIKKPASTAAKDAQKLAEFRKKKRIQQCMNSCHEVREAIRLREREEFRIALEEQMIENERKTAREREMDRYWIKVQEINLQRAGERQRNELCFRDWRNEQMCFVLGKQLEEKAARLEIERKEKAEEVERINNLLREIELEKLNESRGEEHKKTMKYREELQCMIDAKKRLREEENRQLVVEHCQLVEEIKREEEEERQRIALAKKEHKKALLDFIEYIQRMRKLEEDIEKRQNDRIDDLYRVDICTKNNIAEVARRKMEAAQKCYADLRQQICEQYERQRLEEIERRSDKIIENRFAHPEIPRSVILDRKRQFRADLDKQIEEMKIIRAKEEEEHEKKLLRAVCDPEYCRQLAEEYMKDGVDYLDPHPNWLIFLDPCKEYVPKSNKSTQDVKKLMSLPAREPLLPTDTCLPTRSFGPCAEKKLSCDKKKTDDKCIVPCGNEKRWKIPKCF